jgi:hypothetical protein
MATLGASNCTYAEATWTQSLPGWIGSPTHIRAFKSLNGVPEMIVPDNLKSGVHKSCRHEPDLSPTYQDMASHYNCAIISARIRSPKDKVKVQTGVKIVEQWILARLRNIHFLSLNALNKTTRKLLDDHKAAPFQKMSGTRKSMFEDLDWTALKPLCFETYTYAEWKRAKPHIDYYIEAKGFYYSVPYQLVKNKMEISNVRLDFCIC